MSMMPRGPVSVPAVTPPARLHQGPPARLDPTARRARPLMRKYEVLHLQANGDIGEFHRIAPATAAFEDAFAAFARGTLFDTTRGPVAVEDLLPGDSVRTVEDGHRTLLWRGSMTLIPNAAGQRPEMGRLTRLSTDALGLARPMPDLVLGPSARLFNRSRTAQTLARGAGAFVPARDYIDGVSVIELTPPSAVQVYHLGFADQHRLAANGAEVESHHPGRPLDLGLRGDALTLYLSLFPHVGEVADFGPLRYPRLRLADLDAWGQSAAG